MWMATAKVATEPAVLIEAAVTWWQHSTGKK